MNRFLLCCLCLFSCLKTQAQTAPQKNTLNVFIDCTNYGGDCYSSYLRQEIGLVTFVRDRLDADVHIIAKNNQNDIGTQMNTLFVIGQKQLQDVHDTIQYSIPANKTELERREIWTHYIKIALVPYLSQTTLAGMVKIDLKRSEEVKADTLKEKDPFNYWVFQLSTGGNFYGTQFKKDFSAYGNASAIRETDISKWNIYLNAGDQYTKYINDGVEYKYEYRDFSSGVGYIKKLSEHVGFGLNGDVKNSIYSNLKLQYTVGPLFEYSIFPYKEFNNRRLILQYALDSRHNQYYDTTIYLKTKEQLFAQEASGIASFTQKWGSVNVGVFWRNLFQDFSKNSLSFNGAISARIVHGLNFGIWGNYSFIHNQLNIRKGDLSIDQLLAQNREILSDFNFSLGIGLSYRFGSKFNNAVNPCFRGLNYSINL